MGEDIKHINDFQIVTSLGAGGWAEVYHVRNQFGVDLALKYYFDDNKVEDVKSFYNKSSLFNHKNVLSPAQFGEHKERGYITFRLCDRSLMQEIEYRKSEGQTFSDLELSKIINDVSQGLLYINEKGYVHNDLKPDNILQLDIDDSTQYLISDFDVINEFHTGSYLFKPKQKDTKGLAKAYAAPELLTGDASLKSDIFSLGVTIYELIVGDLPISQMSMGLGEAINAEKPIDYFQLEQDLKEIPKRFKDIILACINKDPDQRPSAKQLFELSSRKLNTNSWPAFKAEVPIENKVIQEDKTQISQSDNNHKVERKSYGKTVVNAIIISLVLFSSWFGIEKFFLNDGDKLFTNGYVVEALDKYDAIPFLFNRTEVNNKSSVSSSILNSYDFMSSFSSELAIGKLKEANQWHLINSQGKLVEESSAEIYRNSKGDILVIKNKQGDCLGLKLITREGKTDEISAQRVFDFNTNGDELNYENCKGEIIKLKM